MPDSYPKVSPSAEEYLLTLYRLESAGETVGSSQLAKTFGVKAPSVTGMLRRLHARGWVRYRRYKPPRLTEEGRQVAVRLIRRHRLLETFLFQELDYTWDEVHDEVAQLEHAVSDRLIERIDSKLGYPKHDPHGDPIPDREGHLPDHDMIPLIRLEPGQEAVVGRVDNRSRRVLRTLGDLGAYPGTKVRRLSKEANGRMKIRVQDRELIVDSAIAGLIWVRPDA